MDVYSKNLDKKKTAVRSEENWFLYWGDLIMELKYSVKLENPVCECVVSMTRWSSGRILTRAISR